MAPWLQRYHLLTNNCNHFAATALEFLVGDQSRLPDYVVNLPAEFSASCAVLKIGAMIPCTHQVIGSPLGAMLTPMIDSFFAAMRQNGLNAAPV